MFKFNKEKGKKKWFPRSKNFNELQERWIKTNKNHLHIIIKLLKTKVKQQVEKSARGKEYKLHTGRQWQEEWLTSYQKWHKPDNISKILKNKTKTHQTRIIYPVRTFFQKQKSGIKQLSDKQKQRVYHPKIHITRKCVTERPQAEWNPQQTIKSIGRDKEHYRLWSCINQNIFFLSNKR